MEGDWFERQERFAGFVHWLDIFLEALGGSDRAELTGGVNENRHSVRRRLAKDLADVAAVTHVLPGGANANNVIGREDTDSGATAQGRVVEAGGAVKERVTADGRVVVAGGVVEQRIGARGGVQDAFGV